MKKFSLKLKSNFFILGLQFLNHNLIFLTKIINYFPLKDLIYSQSPLVPYYIFPEPYRFYHYNNLNLYQYIRHIF